MCTICLVKTKAMISCAVTAQLIGAVLSHRHKSGFHMTWLECIPSVFTNLSIMVDVYYITVQYYSSKQRFRQNKGKITDF